MAFDTLGVNVTASGVTSVANQVAKLANAFIKYINVVERTDKAALKAASSQNRLAQAMSQKTANALELTQRRYERLEEKQLKLSTTIKTLTLRMGDGAKINEQYATSYSKLVAATAEFAKETESLEQLTKRRDQAMSAQIAATEAVAAAQKKLTTAETASQKGGFAASLLKKKAALEGTNAALLQVTAALARYKGREQAVITAEAQYKKAANALATYTQQYTNMTIAQRQSAQVTAQLASKAQDLRNAESEVAEAVKAAAQSQEEYGEAQQRVSGSTDLFAGLLENLTGGFGKAATSGSGLAKVLGMTQPQLAAITVAVDAVAVAVRVAQLAFNVFMKILKTAWSIFQKTVQVVWNLAKSIGTTLWNALKKILSFPFSIISKMFGGVGGSLQRVMEMAIGMNASRVWWQLGMKLRDLGKLAMDSAVEYQVTFTRLRGLLLNETLGLLGVSLGDPKYIEKYNNALTVANDKAKELVTWTSQLAITTIFDAEAILDVYTLAMSYDFASQSAKDLTEAVLDFATGMGLGDTEMRRIIENFGQMRAQGKITGTELRDLARGSFVPVNDVLERMAANAGIVGDYTVPNMQEIGAVLAEMNEKGQITAQTLGVLQERLKNLGADGKITRQEFEGLMQDFRDPKVLEKFGLTAEQAGLALDGIKTGQLTAELNKLIATGKLTIDEFFEAFIEMAEDRFPNAAQSMGVSMKAVMSNVQDYIKTMIGWRLIAPVFEVIARHVQNFIQNTLMSPQQIALFDKMGKAFKNITELLMTYSDILFKAKNASKLFFGIESIGMMARFTGKLLDILGSLGTVDFEKTFENFTNAIRLRGLTGPQQGIVLEGIKNLNKIMQDIMAGVEVDPDYLKENLDAVFGTLWEEFFKPNLKSALSNVWTKILKPEIDKLILKIKERFNEWKTEKLMPGLETFLTVTLPGWFVLIKDWIATNGAGVISSVLTFVAEIVGAFEGASAGIFGEDHWLTKLVGLLKELLLFGSVKIGNPTDEVDVAATEAVATAFDGLATALEKAALNSAPVLAFLDFLNKNFPEGKEYPYLTTLANMFSVLGDIGTTSFEAVTTMFDALSNLGIGGGGGIAGIIDSFTQLLAKVFAIASLPALVIMNLIALLQTLGNIWGVSRPIEGDENVLEYLDEIITRAGELSSAKTKVDNFKDSLINLFKFGFGGDPYGNEEKVGGFFAFLKDLLSGGGEPIEVPVAITVVPTYVWSPDALFDENGNFIFKGPQTSDGAVTVPINVDITGDTTVTVNDQPVTNKKSLVEGILGGDWGTGDLEYTERETINIPMPLLNIEGDFTSYGEDLATSLADGFKATIATALSSTYVPMPKIDPKKKQELNDDIGAIVTDMAALFSGDTSVTSAAGDLVDDALAELAAIKDTEGYGIAMIEGVINGIYAKLPDALAAATDAADQILAAFAAPFGIASPSKAFFDFGRFMMQGLSNGIDSSLGIAMGSIRRGTNDLRTAVGYVGNGSTSYNYNTSNISNNWNVKMSAPINASTTLQAYEVLRMRGNG